ncbi:MAG: hypothetical protein PUE63_05425, partial [Lachnospiraceae bacterium]|nr:hypothetical protein [Lachnospiraceae bacterium]
MLAMSPGDAVIDDVDLSGENSRIAAATMVGGLVGAISGKLIKNCDGAAIVALTGSNDIFAQCAAENVTVYGGRVTGTIAGYLSEDSVVSSYTGEMTHSGAAEESEVGGTPEALSLSEVGYGRESTDFGTWT